MARLLEALVAENAMILTEDPSLPGAYDAALLLGLQYGLATITPADRGDPGFADCLAVLEAAAKGRGVACGWLGPYRAGELRARHGIHATAECVLYKLADGSFDQHIVVRHPAEYDQASGQWVPGRTEDPSRALGMKG